MKCIECNKEMKLVGKKRFYVAEDSESTSTINEYHCDNCGIIIFFNMNIGDHHIEKLYLPENLKPTEKQLEFVDYICKILPELIYAKDNYYTRKQVSKFISKYKDLAFSVQKEEQEKASKKVIQSIKRNIKKRKEINE